MVWNDRFNLTEKQSFIIVDPWLCLSTICVDFFHVMCKKLWQIAILLL